MFSALLIDADDAARTAIRTVLTPYGFEFLVADDAPEAMNLARTSPPDVVLLRVELPSASGFSVCNKLRRSDETKYIPLLMYSSDVSEDVFEQHRSLKTRADGYLKLPLEPQRLLQAVRELITIPDQPIENSANSSDSLEVSLDDVAEDEAAPTGQSGAGLSLGEFEQEFGEIDMQEDVAEQPNPDDPLSEETDAAFDALMDDPRGSPRRERVDARTGQSTSDSEDERPTQMGMARGANNVSTTSQDGGEPSLPTSLESSSADSGSRASLESSSADSGSRISLESSSADSGFRAQREVLQLKAQQNAKNREMLALRDELEAKERSILDAKRKHREVQEQLSELEGQLLKVQEEVIGAREAAEAAQRDRLTLAKREEGYKTRLELAQKKQRDVESELRDVQTKLADADSRLQRELGEVRSERDEARTRAETMDAERNRVELELATVRGQIDELARERDDARDRQSEYADTVERLEMDLARLKHDSQDQLDEARQSAAREFERKLAEVQAAAEADKRMVLEAQTREGQAELEFQERQGRVALDKIRAQLGELERNQRAELERMQNDRSRLDARMHTLESEFTNVKHQLETAQAELLARKSAEHRAQQAIAVALKMLDGVTSTPG